MYALISRLVSLISFAFWFSFLFYALFDTHIFFFIFDFDFFVNALWCGFV